MAIGFGILLTSLLVLFAWFYFVMYEWLWLGLMKSQGLGATVGLTIMFVLFIIISIFMVTVFALVVVAGLATSLASS